MDDAPGIAAVDAASDPHPWTVEQVAASLAVPTTLGWVLDEHGIVGHVLVSAAGGQGEVLRLAVHPDHRRSGRGRALMRAAERGWRRTGVGEAFLEVRADNVAARTLYAGMGWDQVGVRPGYYDGGIDAVTMRLTIRA